MQEMIGDGWMDERREDRGMMGWLEEWRKKDKSI